MLRTAKTSILLALILATLASQVSGEIIRVARRYNVIDCYGGSSSPVGKYDGLAGFVDFTEVDADRVLDPTYQVGFSYGQLRNSNMLLKIGFRYTKIEQPGDGQLMFYSSDGQHSEVVKLGQYDLDVNFNYLFMNIVEQSFAPHVGIGLRTGLTNASASRFDSEAHFNSALAANFGAELKVWEGAKKRSFVTLASVNSYDMFASGDRPKYLNIGAALKYYFRP